MKKFRSAKKYTQEDVAEKLYVTAQRVSRWECGNTLPDVILLPEIYRNKSFWIYAAAALFLLLVLTSR
ncbi:MAG: helix-turn-helix transcriptional regulator [Ruminococcaceae bacterium]|nr:helix-turn-helix transcriptional regulator [Oscillospiraceae bacterium]